MSDERNDGTAAADAAARDPKVLEFKAPGKDGDAAPAASSPLAGKRALGLALALHVVACALATWAATSSGMGAYGDSAPAGGLMALAYVGYVLTPVIVPVTVAAFVPPTLLALATEGVRGCARAAAALYCMLALACVGMALATPSVMLWVAAAGCAVLAVLAARGVKRDE